MFTFSGTSSAGAVLAGLGGCGFTILLLLCLHAYFVFYENDESTQTWVSNIELFVVITLRSGIDPSWGGPIELFLVPASAPRLV